MVLVCIESPSSAAYAAMYAKRELWCSAAFAEALTFEPEDYSAVLSDPNGYNAYLHS